MFISYKTKRVFILIFLQKTEFSNLQQADQAVWGLYLNTFACEKIAQTKASKGKEVVQIEEEEINVSYQ